MFGFSKKKIPTDQIVNTLVYFVCSENNISTFKNLLELEKTTSSQEREIYIFSMHAVVNAVQPALDSKETTQKLLNQFHAAVYQKVNSDPKMQALFEKQVHERYDRYYKLLQNLNDEDSVLKLGEEFMNNFFGNTSDGHLGMTVGCSSIYTNLLTLTKQYLEEVQGEFEIK